MDLKYKTIGTTLLVIAILLISISLGMFLYVFNEASLSSHLTDWGAFGSYFGGVISAVITPLALVGAVMALFQQHNSSIKDKKQVTANNILQTIERVEDSLDNELKERKYKIHYQDIQYSIDSNAFNILTNPCIFKSEEIVPMFFETSKEFSKNIIDLTVSEKEKIILIDSYGLFSSAVGKLKFMRNLINEHKRLTNSNFVAAFYKRKYKDAVSLLIQRGYPMDDWNDISEIKNS